MTQEQQEQEEEEEEKRLRLRLTYEANVILSPENGGDIIRTKMKNVSMNGLYVVCDSIIPHNTRFNITIIISGHHSRLTLETTGFVARKCEDGFGLQFEHDIEWFALFSIFEYYGRGESPTTK